MLYYKYKLQTFSQIKDVKNENVHVTDSRALRDKLIIAYLVKKFPVFCGTRRFITVFTRDAKSSVLCNIS